MIAETPLAGKQKTALVFAVLAGLWGGAGVILAAVEAHVSSGPLLSTASDFLLLHAVAVLALAALALAAPRRGGWLLGAAALFLLGSLLFCGDLTFRTLLGAGLFPMAAPVGGTILILGWASVVAAAIAALWPKRG